MSMIRAALGVAALASLAAACAPTTQAPAYAAPNVFRVDDFGWSTAAGTAGIRGRVAYAQGGQAFRCVGSVGLTPDTPYTRSRFERLYGSIDRAALPVAVVRARDVADPNADYRSFVRSAPCADGAFRFDSLPAGSWFLIAPVTAGGEPMVLMQRVQTRAGLTLDVTL